MITSATGEHKVCNSNLFMMVSPAATYNPAKLGVNVKRVVPTLQPADPLVNDPAAFAAMIRAARTASGMTLVDAALTLGVSKQTLTDLETARASVGLATALRLAKELGVAVFAVPSLEREPVRRLILSSRKTARDIGAGPSSADCAAATGVPKHAEEG